MKKFKLKSLVIIPVLSLLLVTLLPINNVAFADDKESGNTTLSIHIKAKIKFVNELAKTEVIEEYDLDELIVEPTRVEIEGYDFQGWFLKDGTQWNFKKDKVTDNTTLYAKYVKRDVPITGFLKENGVYGLIALVLISLIVVTIVISKSKKNRAQ